MLDIDLQLLSFLSEFPLNSCGFMSCSHSLLFHFSLHLLSLGSVVVALDNNAVFVGLSPLKERATVFLVWSRVSLRVLIAKTEKVQIASCTLRPPGIAPCPF